MAGPDKIRLQELAHKWRSGTLTKEEQREFDQWFSQVSDEPLEFIARAQNDEQMEVALFEKIKERIRAKRKVHTLWPRIAAAASVILCLSAGGYLLLHQTAKPLIAQHKNDIAPGGNKAILKLANGKTIVITDARNGVLARQGNTSITKQSAGLLVYKDMGNPNGVLLYDTLTVPRGGQHQVKFADGTIAYINAETQLRIPESFTGKDRTIEVISGDAIFKVAYNAKVPFYVKHQGQITQDMGTEFDVNAYPENSGTKTTLLEGSIKVSANGTSVLLKPSQQSLVSAGSPMNIKTVDVEQVTAWRDGYFLFNNENLESIMRDMARWYDVEVSYTQGQPITDSFLGSISRTSNVSQVLHMLEVTGHVKFTIEGRKIIVAKK